MHNTEQTNTKKYLLVIMNKAEITGAWIRWALGVAKSVQTYLL